MQRIPVFLALLAALPPVRLVGQVAADPLVGCYRIEIGEWTPADHPDIERPVEPPTEFRLLRQVGSGPFEFGETLVRPLLLAQDDGGATWARTGGDSVRVAWSTGFWGSTLQMRIEGDALTGTATSWTDVMYLDANGEPLPDIRARAVARRVECSAEP